MRGFSRRHSLVLLILLVVFSPLLIGPSRTLTIPPLPAKPTPVGQLPLSFEANIGQTAGAARFLAHAPEGTFFFSPAEVLVAVTAPTATGAAPRSIAYLPHTAAPAEPARSDVLRLQFLGANPQVAMAAGHGLPGRINYFVGDDPAKWYTDIPTYADITYTNLYPGIDLRYEGHGHQLKGTYVIAGGADPTQIRWHYNGTSAVTLNAAGDLLLQTADPNGTTFTEHAPLAWQEINGQSVPVATHYAVAADGTIRFIFAAYNAAYPLIVDPTLSYSTFLGGSDDDAGNAIALDSSNNIYVVGTTWSLNFPVQNPLYSGLTGGFNDSDAFVSKLSADGATLLFSTYLGSSRWDTGEAVAVDGSGNIYIAGQDYTNNFPVTAGAFQTIYGGSLDGFAAKISASGSTLLYATYLGGAGNDIAMGIAVDSAGKASVVGWTHSGNFPTTPNGLYPSPSGGGDAFIVKLNATGTAADYATYLGGTGEDVGYGVALDGTGNTYVTGVTASMNFPLANAIQSSVSDNDNAFVTKLNAAGSALVYSTYVGGNQFDEAYGIAVDSGGSVYITGRTQSTNFPTTANAYQPLRGSTDGSTFVTKMNAAGSSYTYSTYLGGTSRSSGKAIGVDPLGNAYVTGTTGDYFPILNAPQATYGGGGDAFITELDASGTHLGYSTYLGGSAAELVGGIAVTNAGDAYITGATTSSTDFPRVSPYQNTFGGIRDAFVSKITGCTSGLVRTADGGCAAPPSTRPVAYSFGGSCADQASGHHVFCRHDLDPVNLATGNAVWHETDLEVTAPGLPFVWQRTYNSLDTQNRALGQGWSLSYDARLDLSVTGQVTLIAENGAQSIYVISGTQYLRTAAESANLYHDGDGTYRVVRPDQTTLHFSATGQLLSTADSAGRTITLGYTSGALSVLTDTVGRSYPVTTDAQHRVTRVTDPSVSRAVVYTYTGNLLTDVQDVRGQVSHYSYTNNQLSAITLPNGQVQVQDRYDTLGRLIGQTIWNTAPYTVTYDLPAPAVNGIAVVRTQVLDSNGQITNSDHDQDGRLLRGVDAYNQASLYAVSALDQPTTITNTLSQTTTQTYDTQGNLLTGRDMLNHGPTYTYDSGNRVRTAQDALGHTTTYTYTAAGLLQQTQDALGLRTTYTYTAVLLQSGATTPLLTSEEDALGRVIRYAYSPLGQPITITNALTQATSLTYDGAGRLTRLVDPSGVAECREYDAADHLTAVVRNCVPGQPATASQNVRTEYGFDEVSRPIWAKNPLGEVTRTNYGNNGQVGNVIYGCNNNGGPSTGPCYTYTPLKPEVNRPISFGYDILGRQVDVVEGTEQVTTHTDYDSLNRPWRTIQNYRPDLPADASTNVTSTVEYNSEGQVTALVDPLGRRTVPGYDLVGRVVTETQNYVDGNPQTGSADADLITRTEYDAASLPVTRTLNYVDGVWDAAHPAEDRRVVTRYDALNRPITVIENYVDGVAGLGEIDTDRITQYQYDAVGNLVATTDPASRVNVTIYDALNRPVTVISNCTDGAGHPQTTNCASGHGPANDENIRTSQTYTVRGEPATATDPLGRVTHAFYDPLSRVTRQVAHEVIGPSLEPQPLNVTTQYAYDAVGHTTIITDATTAVMHYEYNSAGWMFHQIDPTAREQYYRYDGLGRGVVTVDGLGHETHALYDKLGRLTTMVANWQNGVVEPGDGADQDLTTTTVYDAAGRRVAQIGPDGQRTNYTLDGLDRLGQVVENASGTTAPINVTTVYTYDRRGLLTASADAQGHTRSRGYNAAGWQISATDGLSRTTTYGYDRAGRQVTVADPRPVTVTTAYDNQDRPTGITASGLSPITLQYDIAGRRTSLADATGTTSYSYDGLDRVTTAAHSVDGTVNYGYDLVGRRTSLGTSTGAPAISYQYDPAGRLMTVQRGGSPYASATYDAGGRLATLTRDNGTLTHYGYDGVNRTTELSTTLSSALVTRFHYDLNRAGLATGATETLGSTTRGLAYGYDGLHRLGSAVETPGKTYTYTYDLVGNRTAVQVDGVTTQSRSYDAADQVNGWQYDAAGNLLSEGLDEGAPTYTYDPLGQMTGMTRSGSTTTYGYNGEGVLATETTGSSTTRYTLDTINSLPERIGTTTGGSTTWYVRGWGQELSRETSGSITWYGTDRLGSVRGLLAKDGTLTTAYNYDPFGGVESTSVPTDYGFTGEPQTASAGLVYLRARWYNTTAGRFQNYDPYTGEAARPSSLHRYLYGNADPVNNQDPSGRACVAIDGRMADAAECEAHGMYPGMSGWIEIGGSSGEGGEGGGAGYEDPERRGGGGSSGSNSVLIDNTGIHEIEVNPNTGETTIGKLIESPAEVSSHIASANRTGSPQTAQGLGSCAPELGLQPAVKLRDQPRPQPVWPPIEPLAPPIGPPKQKECDCAACEMWKARLPKRVASGENKNAIDYQVRVIGSNIEYDVGAAIGIRETWADGIDCSTCSILEAKLTEGGPGTSAWQGGTSDDAKAARSRSESQIGRYKSVINKTNPSYVTNVKYYTNDPRSIPYFENLLSRAQVPGSVERR